MNSQDDALDTTLSRIATQADELLSQYEAVDEGSIKSFIEPCLEKILAFLSLPPSSRPRDTPNFGGTEKGTIHRQPPPLPLATHSPTMRPIFPPVTQHAQFWPAQQVERLYPIAATGAWPPGGSLSVPVSGPSGPLSFPKKHADSPTMEPHRWSKSYQTNALAIASIPSHSRHPSIRSTLEYSDSVRSSGSHRRPSPPMEHSSMFEALVCTSEVYSDMLSPDTLNGRRLTSRSIVSRSSASNLPVNPLQPYQNMSSVSAATSTTNKRQLGPATRLEITVSGRLAEKGKTQDVVHIDSSPSGNMIACRHSSKLLKIWSPQASTKPMASIKASSYVQPQPRSREHFVRSHAILSENAGLVGIATHFGITLEIYNFSKTGGSPKKVQVIEDAHRWASSRFDAFHTDVPPVVVYRPQGNRIDRFYLVRHPSAKKPFWEDTSNGISLERANLPFIPQFPELAYSATYPILVAAAGPRPGEPPRTNSTMLVAWQMKPVADSKRQASTPTGTRSSVSGSTGDDDIHFPYRFCVPDYAVLQNALPSCLMAHGTTAVSIWIPANHTEMQLPGNKFKRKPLPAPERFVLVWVIVSNDTHMFAIPNVQACISPDCRWVAYCDANAGRFVILDVGSGGDEVWRWPDAGERDGAASLGQLDDLHNITVFEFGADGKSLIVGDKNGGVGLFEVRERTGEAEVIYELGDSGHSTGGLPGGMAELA